MQKTNLKILVMGAAASLGVGSVLAQDDEKIDFATQIYPMVKGSCVQCHQPSYEYESNGRTRTKRPKADLIVSSKEDFLKGGESGAVIVAGKPDESEFLHRTLLPIDDDDHQPPEGKSPQWSDAEKALFAKWIEQGADFGDWVKDETPGEVTNVWDGDKEEGSPWSGKELEAEQVRVFDEEGNITVKS